MEKIYSIIPKRSIVILFACVSGVVLIVLAGIVPQQIRGASLDNKIATLQFQISEQKKLQPYYQLLKMERQTSKSRVLPFPPKRPLPRTSIDTVPTIIRGEAQKAHIDMVAASPDLNTLGGDHRFLLVNTVLKGDFENFRKFLIGLGGVPSLESVEEIRIQQNEDSMEFRMKIWLAVA
ncbi:MAG TPA: hypothetical protein VLZ07_01205 [Syntrophales bacterium]|nr:hypothetical protein [Syntrophales bacterium]